MPSDAQGSHHESIVLGVIKDPQRVGPLLAFKDEDSGPGLRGPTDAENDTKQIQEALVDAVDESAYESGDEIVRVHVPEDGESYIEWLIDDPPEVEIDG